MRSALTAAAALLCVTLLVVSPVSPLPGSLDQAHASARATPKASERDYATPSLANGAKAPTFSAQSWVVADLDSGRVFNEKSPDKPLAPASVMKLLTGLTLVDVLKDKQATYTATDADSNTDGTKVGMMAGNKYTVDQMFHAMLMSSANDASVGLGKAAGGESKAIALMSQKAKDLGLRGTVPKTLNGLDAPGQSMTTRDLIIIAKAVSQNPYLMKVIGTQTYMFPGGKNPVTKKTDKPFQIQNHTKVAGTVPGALGLKNGYTVAARGSFVCAIKRGERTYAAAILSSVPNPRQPCVDLITWALNQKSPRTVATIPVSNALPSETPSPQASQAASPQSAAAGAPSSAPVSLVGIGAMAVAALGVLAIVVTVFLRRRKSSSR